MRVCTVSALLLVVGVLGAQWREPTAERREDAYRHNNIGVARLEQYDYAGAAAEFERALALHPDLAIARLNLAIARLYEGQLGPAARHGQLAVERLTATPHAKFVLGLIARADNRPDDAAALFEQVVAADPADAGSRVQLGQVRLAQRRFTDAASLFEAALRLEPFNATAAYGLATAITRGGDRERGATAMERFQRLRDNPAAITYEGAYLAQGRYGEAIASTGLEADLVERGAPAVSFVDATAGILPRMSIAATGMSLADIDRDGDLDLLVAHGQGVNVLRNTGGRFAASQAILADGATSVVAGDYDNDGARDLAVLTRGSISLYRGGGFQAITPSVPPVTSPRAAAFVDVDPDGELDLVAGAPL